MSEFDTDTEDFRKIHVVFLHNRLGKLAEDRYLVDMAIAMQEEGHMVSIYTSEFNQQNCFREVDRVTGCVHVYYSGWWLPKSFRLLRSVLMALRMVFFPPDPKPDLIVLDINTVALYFLSMWGSYKTVYMSHFMGLHQVDYYTKFMKIIPDKLSARALKYTDGIVVQSEGMADIFKRSFPKVHKEVKIVHPCVDTGLWSEDIRNISWIVPDIPSPSFLFVCFGVYKKRSNFELILNAYDDLLLIAAANMRNNLHLVIAGPCNDKDLQEKLYYDELLLIAREKSCAAQVTFLKNIPIVYKKTLIEESIAVLFPCEHDVFPDMILPVLAAGRTIIATNTGFAKVALRHRITAILVDSSPQMFAAAMYKVLANPAIQVFLSDMGHDLFFQRYSNFAFRRKVIGFVSQYTKEKKGKWKW